MNYQTSQQDIQQSQPIVRRSKRSRASAALFYSQLQELTRNIKHKSTSIQITSVSQCQSQHHHQWLPYKNQQGSLSFVQLILDVDQKINRTAHLVKKRKRQSDDEIYEVDKVRNSRKKIQKINGKQSRTCFGNNNSQGWIGNNQFLEMLISCADKASGQSKLEDGKQGIDGLEIQIDDGIKDRITVNNCGTQQYSYDQNNIVGIVDRAKLIGLVDKSKQEISIYSQNY